MKFLSDIQLMALLAGGFTWPMNILIKRYGDMVYRFAVRFLCDEAEAEDVSQEVFIKVWKNASSYDRTHRLSTWIYRITYNLLIDKSRDIRRRAEAMAGYKMLSSDKEDFRDKIDAEDFERLYRTIVLKLSPAQRTVFCLSEIEQMKNDEIAEVTGMTRDSVKSNLYLARKNVREMLEPRRRNNGL